MKVLFIPSWYPSAAQPLDGIFIKEQAEAIATYGVDVAVIYGAFNYKNLEPGIKISKSIESGIPVFRGEGFALPKLTPLLMKGWVKKYIKLYEAYEKEFGKPDVIHAHSFIAGYFAIKLRDKINRPVLLTEHHNELLLPREKQNERYIKSLNFVTSEVDQIIAVGDELGEAIKTISYRPLKIIPNYIDSSMFKCKTNSTRSKNAPFKILGVGDFDKNKGFEYLIRAIDLIINEQLNVKLKLIGSGPLENKFKQFIEQKNLTKVVQLVAPKDRKEIAIEMQAADLFCLPSATETFGMVLVEALASGTPVIACAKGGPEEFVNSTNGLLIPFGNEHELAEGIRNVMLNYDQYKADDISTSALKRYGKASVIPQVVDVYKSLISNLINS